VFFEIQRSEEGYGSRSGVLPVMTMITIMWQQSNTNCYLPTIMVAGPLSLSPSELFRRKFAPPRRAKPSRFQGTGIDSSRLCK
jgi:hypothetical protein